MTLEEALVPTVGPGQVLVRAGELLSRGASRPGATIPPQFCLNSPRRRRRPLLGFVRRRRGSLMCRVSRGRCRRCRIQWRGVVRRG